MDSIGADHLRAATYQIAMINKVAAEEYARKPPISSQLASPNGPGCIGDVSTARLPRRERWIHHTTELPRPHVSSSHRSALSAEGRS